MRTLKRNKRKMYYSLLIGTEPEYNSAGQRTGKKTEVYSEPVEFFGNIAFNSGEIVLEEYGTDVGNYDAILIMDRNELPITETSVLWFENEPKYNDEQRTIVDGKSADYRVSQVKPLINSTKYILNRLN